MPPPPTGRPRGGSISKFKTTSCPPCLGEALRRESYRIGDDFHGSGVNVQVHTRFYRVGLLENHIQSFAPALTTIREPFMSRDICQRYIS